MRRQGQRAVASARRYPDMVPWISQHSDFLIVIANFGILAVWLFYAQLLLNSVIKQRRPRVLINEVKGRDLDAELIVANMSEEKIFIQLLLALIRSNGDVHTHAITDVFVDDDSSDHPERSTSQGPLDAGGAMSLGSFRRVAQQVSPGQREQSPWQSLEIRLVFFYGSKSTAVAAIRNFRFEESEQGKRFVVPDSLDTHLYYRVWHRQKIWRWLREYG